MDRRQSEMEGKKGADASFLPAYYYSPWKKGRTKEEQEALVLAEELELEDGVREIGNYTFYGCGHLRKLVFTDSLKQIGGGSFTGCSALRELFVTMDEGNTTCIRDVVAETFHEVYVTIYFRNLDTYARLVFPEYYEEGVENTPARILETHFHGSGYRYRQCFTDKKIDYQRYDTLFDVAKVYEKPEILIPMSMGRLVYPYALGGAAEAAYMEYVRKHLKEAEGYYLKRRDWYEPVLFLGRKAAETREEMEILIQEAARRNHTEAVSLLMEERGRRFPVIKKTFEF